MNSSTYYPENIFVEKSARNYALTKEILSKCRKSKIYYITKYTDLLDSDRSSSCLESKNLFLTKQKSLSLIHCPCSKGHVSCNYYVLDLGVGCPFRCSYCYLNYYGNTPGIIMPVNINEILKTLSSQIDKNKFYRIGTGEFTDSLAFDHITEYSKFLIPYFSKLKNTVLELKTKSVNIENLLKIKHGDNIVISWSVNPDNLIRSEERNAPLLKQRIDAAKKCVKHGYKIGFHFDPIILCDQWQNKYSGVINTIFKNIDPINISWISLGALRFNKAIKNTIKTHFPKSKIIYGEQVQGLDDKLRYFRPLRTELFSFMESQISKFSIKIPVYLCMETNQVWEDTKLNKDNLKYLNQSISQ